MREADERKKAEKVGRVRVRVFLPDDLVLEAQFLAVEPLSGLAELLTRHVAPQYHRGLYLFTTPPKQELKVGRSDGVFRVLIDDVNQCMSS